MKRFTFCLSLIQVVLLWAAAASAQTFTRADTLRGMLTPLRTAYDVTFYDLDLRVDPAEKRISGSNTIHFRSQAPFQKMQIDLHHQLNIDKITLDNLDELPFTREGDAVFVQMPRPMETGKIAALTIFYGGIPIEGRRPPWEGGLTWTRTKSGDPWVIVTCQGTGANVWWPNKDHQSDEPDSIQIAITVPPGLQNISNGRLREHQTLPDGWERYVWFVSYPINNYNVTLNIGKFAHFRDRYRSALDSDTLTLDYYVLPENLDKARRHFRQVHGMMDAFEKAFGKYPFYRDGYKLIESPHNGMEHQSAVAYGNRYLGGYIGRAPAAVGLKFDFIIIHETAHEWWGNNVTSKDIADMWIHESFGAYSEAIYIEHHWGYEAALKYINGKKQGVQNDRPIQGTYSVQHRGSGDMYNKGQLVLNTLRSVIDDDRRWFEILRGLQVDFALQSIDAIDVFTYINEKSGKDLFYFYAQYLQKTDIPTLEVQLTRKGDHHTARYRWKADVADFRMPVKVTTTPGKYGWIYPTTEYQETSLDKDLSPEDFRVAEDLFYVNANIRWVYLDPGLPDTH